MAPDCINFINKDDARRILLALLEKIADPARADADKHFHEVRTGNREERHVCFAGNRACQQSFAGAWRSDQQHALGNTTAQFLELLRILQELDNFLQLFLGFVGTRNIFKGHFFLLRGEQSRPRLAEAECFVSARLHLPHQEQAEANQQQQRQRVQQNNQPVSTANFLYIDEDRLIAQHFAQVWSIFLENGGAELFVGWLYVFALQFIAVGGKIHCDFLDVALLDVGHELAVAGGILALGLAVLRNQPPEHHAQQHDGEPE